MFRVNQSIQSKLMFAMILFDVALTVAFSTRIYYTHKESILEGVDRQLQSAAQGIPFVLPEGFHGQWMDSLTMPESLYQDLSVRMDSFARDNGVNFLYSFMKSNDSVLFVFSSNELEKFKTGEAVKFRDHYPEASELLRSAFDRDGIQMESTEDEFGDWRSALIRRTTIDGKTFVLGADIDIRYIQRLLHKSLIQSLVIGVLSFLIILFLTYKLARSITNPIKRLEAHTRQLVEQEFDIGRFSRVDLESLWKMVHDESGRLAHTFLIMLDNLDAHMKQLEAETAIRNRIESEMSLAGEIQKSFFPQVDRITLPNRINISGDSMPARNAGGDLYDFFPIDENRFLFALGDVSDKGMPAALFMAISVILIRETASRTASVVDIMTTINKSLNSHNEACQFVTLFLGILDARTGQFEFVNGGHNPPVIRHADGTLTWIKDRHGPALGVLPMVNYKHGVAVLKEGDTFILYTDGITEAFNDAGEQYGEHRLLHFVESYPMNLVADQILRSLWSDVAGFVQGAHQSDDITTLVIRYNREISA